ncbi:SDR family NAD(P)-dependent oxidoreductase [Trichocoleus sp. FACHB-262]|uniref:SDR family NAD(P)-dependent oxidoreductase n=1 Tax=Trichocoleus sp. FACHB-262 TaxID=2692869 RepID=UPI00168A1163|nr:SDR family oxidoreductase [Trichocoleus sp. FACHB-262]MBD2124627.1 SDR family oxidoreductase [Trichocoleus sp. FACHB-262]
MDIPPEQLDLCFSVLQQIADDPSLLEQHDRLKPLINRIHRKMRRVDRRTRRGHDRQLQATTAIVRQQLQPPQKFLTPSLKSALPEEPQGMADLCQPKPCYICKQPYTQLHPFYHSLCPKCAELNYQKRQQRTDLTGRMALVTGGRIKIGYQTGLRLLRDGAQVLLTTRFPRDCAYRYSQEADFDQWRDRLQIYGLDLRNLPALETFIQHLLHTTSHLDILINNAAQTIKRSRSFYQSLLNQERQHPLCPAAQALLVAANAPPLLETSLSISEDRVDAAIANLQSLDADGQPIDLRAINSWSLKLDQVSSLELVEVQLVNAIAPFILNSQLKPLLLRSTFDRRFIINVSAMEGQFNRSSKTVYHPHTNMAKAALNMMTRTAAADYAQDNIFMNSVDTGWITDENPYPKKMHLQHDRGFYTPLDPIDGMARIYDPIVQGIEQTETPFYGYFLKDYIPYPW